MNITNFYFLPQSKHFTHTLRCQNPHWVSSNAEAEKPFQTADATRISS
jgi:hypothetical protein